MPRHHARLTIALTLTLAALAAPAHAEDPQPQTVRLAFSGDIALMKNKQGTSADPIPWERNRLRFVAPLFKRADLAIVNFEGVMTREPRNLHSGHLWSPLEGASIFKPAHVQLVGLANNHANDSGADGLAQTMGALEGQGLATIGAGDSAERAYQPYIHPVGDRCVAVLPAVLWSNRPVRGAMHLAQYNPLHDDSEDRLVANVRAARARCDLVVVYIHWGLEFRHRPHKAMRDLAHKAVQAGAGLVVGHHPHVLQGVEFIDDAAVVYSLGNFVFPNTRRFSEPRVRTGGVLLAEVDMASSTPHLVSLALAPTLIEPRELAPVPLDNHRQRARLRDDLERWSQGFNTRVVLKDDGLIHFSPLQHNAVEKTSARP